MPSSISSSAFNNMQQMRHLYAFFANLQKTKLSLCKFATKKSFSTTALNSKYFGWVMSKCILSVLFFVQSWTKGNYPLFGPFDAQLRPFKMLTKGCELWHLWRNKVTSGKIFWPISKLFCKRLSRKIIFHIYYIWI